MVSRDKLNSRKLAFALLSYAVATVMLCIGQIEGENWTTVVITIGGAYMASQAYVDRGNGRG